MLALLSVAAERAVAADVPAPITAASDHWRRGEKALANIRLLHARLPRLASEVNARNVRDAADLLDGGLTPHALMTALGFDTAALQKFDPGQPRLPAGSGLTGGQWTGRRRRHRREAARAHDAPADCANRRHRLDDVRRHRNRSPTAASIRWTHRI